MTFLQEPRKNALKILEIMALGVRITVALNKIMPGSVLKIETRFLLQLRFITQSPGSSIETNRIQNTSSPQKPIYDYLGWQITGHTSPDDSGEELFNFLNMRKVF